VTRSIAFAVRPLAVCALLAATSACSKADTTPPVATVTFSASRTRVALGSPVDLTYKFDVAQGAAISGDYSVFMHVVGDDGQQLWTDDHMPPVPTSQWKPGQTIGPYTRLKFVPLFPYVGHATVIMGLYKGDARLTLMSSQPDERLAPKHEYKVGNLELLPATENVRLIMLSGWNGQEFQPNNPTVEWQWSQKTGVIGFQNPKKDVTLYLESDARHEVFPTQQTVSITINGQPVTTFAASSALPELRRIPITAAQLGAKDMAELRIEVDRTFVPSKLPNSAKDNRELGLRVYHVFVEVK
jgi:hypothetical protein